MNKIINKVLSAGSNLHLRQLEFIYSACGPFTKLREWIQKFKETGNLNYICKNELDKACFTQDAAYSDSKDLAKSKLLSSLNIMDIKDN